MAICLNQNRNQLCFIFGFVLLLSPIDLPQVSQSVCIIHNKVYIVFLIIYA